MSMFTVDTKTETSLTFEFLSFLSQQTRSILKFIIRVLFFRIVFLKLFKLEREVVRKISFPNLLFDVCFCLEFYVLMLKLKIFLCSRFIIIIIIIPIIIHLHQQLFTDRLAHRLTVANTVSKTRIDCFLLFKLWP